MELNKLHLRPCHKPCDISNVKTATVSRSPIKSLPLTISHGALIHTVPVVIKCVPHILSRSSSRTQNFRAHTHTHTHTHTFSYLFPSINQTSVLTADINHKAATGTRHRAGLQTVQCITDSSASLPKDMNFKGLYPENRPQGLWIC
jgi:hypothetical protein